MGFPAGVAGLEQHVCDRPQAPETHGFWQKWDFRTRADQEKLWFLPLPQALEGLGAHRASSAGEASLAPTSFALPPRAAQAGDGLAGHHLPGRGSTLPRSPVLCLPAVLLRGLFVPCSE